MLWSPPYCCDSCRENAAHDAEVASSARESERARIRKALLAIRATWRARMDRNDGHDGGIESDAEAFEGAARAVQALDEAIKCLRAPRRTGQ